MLSREVSGRAYPEIGVPDAHHGCSHHQNDPAKLEKLAKINTFHMQQFAYFLDKLQSTPDGDGTGKLPYLSEIRKPRRFACRAPAARSHPCSGQVRPSPPSAWPYAYTVATMARSASKRSSRSANASPSGALPESSSDEPQADSTVAVAPAVPIAVRRLRRSVLRFSSDNESPSLPAEAEFLFPGPDPGNPTRKPGRDYH